MQPLPKQNEVDQMKTNSETDALLTIKKRLSPIKLIEYVGSDLASAHRKLGEEVKNQVYSILSSKLSHMDESLFVDEIRLVRRCKSYLQQKAVSTEISPIIRNSVTEYLECLSSWGDGVDLGNFQHPRLSNIIIDEYPVSKNDLEILLQNDNSGCQTGVYRDKDDSIILWHTEEDVEDKPSSRFDKIRVVSFRLVEENSINTLNAFIYADLLPGPAFSWCNNNFVQAVDALFIKSGPQNGPVLANIVSWLSWRLGNKIHTKEIIETLQPFADGYAITTVSRIRDDIYADKIEFAGDLLFEERLANNEGRFLFQVNVFSKKDSRIATKYEEISRKSRRRFENRILRTERAINGIRNYDEKMLFFLHLLTSRSGGSLSYANEDVKAYFIARISRSGLEIWIDAGPAHPNDIPTKMFIPVD